MIRLISADGASYRVRLAVKVWMDSVLTTFSSPQVDFSPGSPGDMEIDLPESGDWAFHSVDVAAIWVSRSEEWQTIDIPGAISGSPADGVKILSAVIVRRGWRWGFIEHVEAGEWPEDMPGGPNQSGTVRFYRKRIFRLRRSAVSSK